MGGCCSLATAADRGGNRVGADDVQSPRGMAGRASSYLAKQWRSHGAKGKEQEEPLVVAGPRDSVGSCTGSTEN